MLALVDGRLDAMVGIEVDSVPFTVVCTAVDAVVGFALAELDSVVCEIWSS